MSTAPLILNDLTKQASEIETLFASLAAVPEWYSRRFSDAMNRTRGFLAAAKFCNDGGEYDAAQVCVEWVNDDLGMINDRIADWTEEVGGYE